MERYQSNTNYRSSLSYHDQDHLRSVLQPESCRDVGSVPGAVAPGEGALLLPAPLRRVRGGCGGGGRGGARHWSTHSLVLVGAVLLDVIPVEATWTEALDWSEVYAGVVPPTGAGVCKTSI